MTKPLDPASPNAGHPRRATAATLAHNRAIAGQLDFHDQADFEDARRGFIGSIANARIERPDGHVVWDLGAYDFLASATSPDEVNPSLWRQARLNHLHGLFEVVPGIYQVRGFDLANMTIIEGERGAIVIDPLMFSDTSAAAWALYTAHRGERPIVALIYSHCHPDHYGGVEGVISAAAAAAGDVQVIAPDGFLEAALAETILAGVPMRRRAMFQFGATLPPGPCGHVDAGLGKTTGRGTTSLIAPNWLITEPVETHTIDGVEIVFQLTPETEAPAEMNFFFPAAGVLNLAENGCHTMHNLCPIRGARTRDALAWSKYLDDALERFIDRTDVVIAQHHWPTWGRERIRRFISEQRDLYRYLHDQTLRLMGHGLTPDEIAAAIALPENLRHAWHARPYYGALQHNVRAIYAHYMGPYDGNPTNLDPLPPVVAGARYVEYMGGADAVRDKARRDFEAGDFRWVVQVLHHVVFADPADQAARELAADAMEQMGYQAESATWRNAYLLGARELRFGAPKPPPGGAGAISPKVVAMMPMDMFLDFLAVRLNGPEADGLELRIDWAVAGTQECHRLTLVNGALSHTPGSHGEAAHAGVTLSRAELTALVLSGKPLVQLFDEGHVRHDGDGGRLRTLLALLDQFDPMFNILVP
ncbi:MAG: alkyl sulfatase dimerization domain-containing protein [Pseudomonadota bacterium]